VVPVRENEAAPLRWCEAAAERPLRDVHLYVGAREGADWPRRQHDQSGEEKDDEGRNKKDPAAHL